MTTTLTPAETPSGDIPEQRLGRAVEIVVPVHNEQGDLATSVRRLHAYLCAAFPFSFRITIADNASTDQTWAIATALARELPYVDAQHLEEKGRGRALRAVWSRSEAKVLCYMDVDLSTDLAALLPLVAPLVSGHSDVAIGTRLARSAHVVRGPKRELISRCYNALLHTALAARFSDAQCGFKAIRADRARELLPQVRDDTWFFDTELLVRAERSGMRIHEVPVDWVDDPDSRVDIVATAIGDLKGIGRLLRDQFNGQLLRFCGIGVGSTLAYLIIYSLLRMELSAPAANTLALLSTTVANTAANRSYTFGVRGRAGRIRHQLRGFVAFALGLGITSAALALLHGSNAHQDRIAEVASLVAANLVATVARFVLFKRWVFSAPVLRPAPAATSVKELS